MLNRNKIVWMTGMMMRSCGMWFCLVIDQDVSRQIMNANTFRF